MKLAIKIKKRGSHLPLFRTFSFRRKNQPKTLVNLYFSASFFQLGNQSVSVSLANTFLNGLGSAVNEVLGFLQTEASQVLNDLYDVQLVSAGGLQDYVKGGLFFSGSSSATTSSRTSNSYSSSCRLDAVFFLQDLC